MKRAVDVVMAMVVLAPVGIVVCFLVLLVMLVDRMPGWFVYERVGRRHKSFRCIKINSMRPPRDESDINNKRRDARRVTALGKWLRNRGLDELPQILNILAGDMAFVGPRPLLLKNYHAIRAQNPGDAATIEQWERERLDVRPGLSGWHQIHSPGPGIVRYDLEYLRKPTLAKHLKVFGISVLIMAVGKQRYFK